MAEKSKVPPFGHRNIEVEIRITDYDHPDWPRLNRTHSMLQRLAESPLTVRLDRAWIQTLGQERINSERDTPGVYVTTARLVVKGIDFDDANRNSP